MKTLRDKVAAITGAGSGLGRATALEFAARGCHLALSDIDAAGVEETAAACRRLGVRAHASRVDVTDRAAVHAWADAAAAHFGRVHVIVNNAGVGLGATVRDMRYEDLEWLMAINFWGVIHGTKAFLPHLDAAGEGHVVNISSLLGLIGVPTQAAYNAAKFAIRGFTEALREELAIEGSPIGVTCIHPGGVRTKIAANARIVHRPGWVDAESLADVDKMLRTRPEHVARTIAEAIVNNRGRVVVGADARLMDWLQRLLPVGYQRFLVAGVRWRRRRSLPQGVAPAAGPAAADAPEPPAHRDRGTAP